MGFGNYISETASTEAAKLLPLVIITEDLQMQISKKLASARKQRHMSLGMASRYSGIPKSTLWRYENACSRVPAETVSVLAKLYGVNVATILGGDDQHV